MDIWDLTIIGAGASGLACAISAGHQNPRAKILVLEKLDRVGKKLLATGNGRCNLSNTAIRAQAYHTGAPELLETALKYMPTGLVTDFFENLGLLCRTQPDGLIYPYCNQASVVLDCLRGELDYLSIPVECSCGVKEILPNRGLFTLTAEDGRRFLTKRVVLAAGGTASPKLGSTGEGFSLARQLGHSVNRTSPALLPLPCPQLPNGLKGIRALGEASLYRNGRLLRCEKGELQFTEGALSGIPIFQLTTHMDQNAPGGAYMVTLDLLPQLTRRELGVLLSRRARCGKYSTAQTLLQGILANRLSYAVMKACGISPLSLPTASLPASQLEILGDALKGWRLQVVPPTSWENAQVTLGGIPLSQVELPSFGSRACRGIYLTGELLDVTGDCGGYNLHWAFSSGILAGRHAVTGAGSPKNREKN